MSAPKWTPGRWHADAVNQWHVWSDDCKVAETTEVNQADHYREPPLEERIANAHLIAAAPEMAAVLEKLAARNPLYTKPHERLLIKEAIAVLAKARGEA